jgi:chromosome segregation ATPase
MANKSKHKVKTSSSPKYVSSDEEVDSEQEPLLCDTGKGATARIKGLMEELVARDELLEKQEDLLVQERQSNLEHKKLLKLEKGKNEKLDLELDQSKETISSLKSSSGALQDSFDALQKTHKDLEVQLDTLWSSTSSFSSGTETTKPSISNGCNRYAIMLLILMLALLMRKQLIA